jgi:tol-pal system protein YbgF
MLEKQLMTSESQLQEQLDINDQLLTASAEIRATMDAFRVDVQSLTGRVDEVAYSVQSGNRSMSDSEEEIIGRLNRIDEIARTNKDRIAAVEQYLDFEVAPAKAVPAAGSGSTPVSSSNDQSLSEAQLYKAAKQAFDDGQYETAREMFKEFLSKYPKSENADNAQFWVGEIYYREKWYAEAIMEYQKVIEDYPDGNKVPASLLKQGLSFANLGEEANARTFLEEVIKQYPSSNEAKIARDKLETF